MFGDLGGRCGISEGLGAADRVIVYPSDRVSDGTRIETMR
jgi:hypothetical protein